VFDVIRQFKAQGMERSMAVVRLGEGSPSQRRRQKKKDLFASSQSRRVLKVEDPARQTVSVETNFMSALSIETRRFCSVVGESKKMTGNSRRMSMRNGMLMALVLGGVSCLAVPASHAQAAASKDSPTVSDQDIKLLRQDIRSTKKQLLAANLTLTDAEATKFWPVYDQYAAELTKIGDQKYALIKEYAQGFGSLTDAQALSLLNRTLAVDEAIVQLRIKYVPIVGKVLPGTKTATFFQIDRRLSMLIDLQVSSQIPLVQDQH
jgi:hypothetical protein